MLYKLFIYFMKLYIYCIYVLGTYISLHEKPYFPGPGIY